MTGAPTYYRRNQAIEDRAELDEAAMEAGALAAQSGAVTDLHNPRQSSMAIRERALAQGRNVVMDYRDIARDQQQAEDARWAELRDLVRMSLQGRLQGRDLDLREQAIRDERGYRQSAIENERAQLEQQGAYQQGQLAQGERALAADERKLAATEREGQLTQFTPESVAAYEKSKAGGAAGDPSLLERDPMSGKSARPPKDTWDPKKNVGYYHELLKQAGYDTSVFNDRNGEESPESKRFKDTLNAMYQMDGGADLSHEELARHAAEFMKLGKLDQGSDGGQKPGSKVGTVISVNTGGSIDGPRIAAGGSVPQGATAAPVAAAPPALQDLPPDGSVPPATAMASQVALGATAPPAIVDVGTARRVPEKPPAMTITVRGKTHESSPYDQTSGVKKPMRISVGGTTIERASPEQGDAGINPKTGLPRNARVAPDGKWYVPDGRGGWLQVWDE